MCENNHTGKVNDLSYLKIIFKNAVEYPDIGYVVRDTNESSNNFGYKALLDRDLSPVFESYPYKKSEKNSNIPITDFKVCGRLLIVYELEKPSESGYRDSVNIQKIYTIEHTIENGKSTTKLVDCKEILTDGLREIIEFKWDGKFIAYIASYDFGGNLYNSYGIVIYDLNFNRLAISIEDLKKCIRSGRKSYSKKASDRQIGRLGAGIKYDGTGPKYVFNTFNQPIIYIKTDENGNYKLVES